MDSVKIDRRKVCPAEIGGMLDNRFRRWLHPRKQIVGPYVHEGDFVLDLGCGPGSFTDSLAELIGPDGRVLAVDLQEKMLRAMKRKITQLGLEGRVIAHPCRADSLLLEEYREKADFALAFWMVHETPDPLSFLAEVHTALKPGGQLLCTEPKMHVSEKLYREMVEGARDLGFRVQPVEGIRMSRAVLFTKE
ncbi:MAG: class I SAM-dependent methyltransferase [Spirochaetales bacterium]|nr:class I SAM-dependent methyltransferase [Spirochaetales bacterium]